MTEWFHARISRLGGLGTIEEKKDVLAEIKIKLGDLVGQDLKRVADNLDLGAFFALLTSNDRELSEPVCEVLKILMSAAEAGEIHRRYPNEISMCVSHEESVVKTCSLRELQRVADEPGKLPQLLRDTDLLVAVVERIGDDDLAVAKCAMDVVKKLGENVDALKILYTGPLLRTIAKLLSKNDVVSFRVYDVVVHISKASKEGLEASVTSGFLSSLVANLENEDILIQLNVLEAMTNLALTEEGLAFLEGQDVLKKLADKIARANENPLSTLLIPGLMKFFGNVARCRPSEIFSKYPVVVSSLFEVIESADQTILVAALDTLAHICTSIEGKYALQDLGECMPGAMRRIGEIIQKMPSEIRVRGLNGLALILDVDKPQQDNRIVSLTKSWFDALGENPLGMIVAVCKQPFADIRQAGLEVLAVLANQLWGQEYIANHPGLIEFLLDRDVESFKECKDAKYAVVKNLAQGAPDIFDPNTVQRLQEFVNKGAVFVDATMEVAFEGAS